MSKRWYMVQTYAGYENKVEQILKLKFENNELDSSIITDVLVPIEERTEIKDGKKKIRKDKFLPGYIMLEVDMPDTGWKKITSSIRSIQGVNGFVGVDPNVKPRPITDDEARNILVRAGRIKGEKIVHTSSSFMVGDQVKITKGNFANFSGVIDTVDAEKSKYTVMVQIFGRATPVEVDFTQVEKLVQ